MKPEETDRKKEISLKEVALFNGLDNAQLRDVARISVLRRYKKGEYVFKENTPGNALYIIVSGIVKIFKVSKQGRRKTLALLKKGDFFGEMAGLDRQARSANAQALEDVEVLIIRQETFEKSLKRNPGIAINIMETLCARLRSADSQIEDLAFRNVMGRIGTTLLELAQKHGIRTKDGIRIDLKLSHREIAEMAGTARELATKVLARLKRNGCLKVIDNQIYIVPRKLSGWIH